MSSASISMSNRAPNALAMPRAARQPAVHAVEHVATTAATPTAAAATGATRRLADQARDQRHERRPERASSGWPARSARTDDARRRRPTATSIDDREDRARPSHAIQRAERQRRARTSGRRRARRPAQRRRSAARARDAKLRSGHVRDCNVRRKSPRIDADALTTRGRSGSRRPGAERFAPSRCRRRRPATCVVRALYSGISRGTEALVFSGRVPASEYERMRAPFQAGEFPGAGQVRLRERRRGRAAARASCRAATSSCSIRIRRATSCRPRPCTCCPTTCRRQRAVLAANLETAINGVWDARPHDRRSRRRSSAPAPSAAWSRGWPARIPGCDVELVDINPQRAAVARALGVRFAAPGDASRTTRTS